MGSQPQQLMSFEAAVTKMLEPAIRPWWTAVAAQGGVVVAFTGLGLAAHTLTRPSTTVAVVVAAAAIVTVAALRLMARNFHMWLIGWIDWGTAVDYWSRVGPGIPRAAAARIALVVIDTCARYPAIAGIHPYLIPCPGGNADGPCRRGLCLNAAVTSFGTRRIVIIGHRMLDLPGDQFEAVLRHEMRHTTGLMAVYHAIQPVLTPSVWFAAGYLPLSPWSAVAAWVVLGGSKWVNELIADWAAVRAVGTRAALALLDNLTGQSRGMRLHHHAINVLLVVLFPSHPPLLLRRLFARLARYTANRTV